MDGLIERFQVLTNKGHQGKVKGYLASNIFNSSSGKRA